MDWEWIEAWVIARLQSVMTTNTSKKYMNQYLN